MLKTKSSLVSQLDEQKRNADDEARERVTLLGKYRNLEHEADGLRENLQEETVARENITRQMNKAMGDADMWRRKYEIDGCAKAEELEMSKLKLQARLSENQATIEQLNAKLHQIEKGKGKLEGDLQDMSSQLDQAQILNSQMEKRAKQYAKDNVQHFYFMALTKDQFVDATCKGNISRFINHSCDPNSETQKWTVNGELRVGFFTKRAIKPGEEVSFDYKFERYGNVAQKCFCGSSQCRGWLGGEPGGDSGVEEVEEWSEDDDDEEDLEEAAKKEKKKKERGKRKEKKIKK